MFRAQEARVWEVGNFSQTVSLTNLGICQTHYMHPRQFFTWSSVLRYRYQIGGVVLLAFGLGATILLAYNASSDEPPSGGESAVYVIVSGVLNIGGVWLFSRNPGGANLTASEIAFRHLGEVAYAVADVAEKADAAFDSTDGRKLKDKIGHISVQLSAIEQRLGSNLEDWVQAHPDLSPGITVTRTQKESHE